MMTATPGMRRRPLVYLPLLVTVLALSGCGGSGTTTNSTPPPSTPPPSSPPPPAPLSVTTMSLPNGQVAVAYSSTLAATGGTTPYRWAVSSGTLPPGLALDATTGVIAGTPAGGANGAALTVQVTDAATPAQTATMPLTLTVLSQALQTTTFALPNGNVGTLYDATLTADGGTPPYSWSLTSGTLPAGLSLNAASGAITGTPTANSFATALTFTVTDTATPPKSVNAALTLTINAVPLLITTTTLPNGKVGDPYSQILAASGGTGARTWTVSAGALPAGLTLNSGTGTLSGIPSVTAAQTPITFSVTDSGSPAQTQSAAYTLTVAASGITVDVTPHRAALTLGQTLTLIASTDDGAGVTWSSAPAGGSFSPAASANGAAVTFTAPMSAGVYTLTATSVTDNSHSASASVGVTDLAGVYTYHNDVARDGANAQEYALTPANVNTATFGKLFSCAVDGAVYAQPLWVANLSIAGVTHNVVFVATEHDSLYAFDADAAPCQVLWQASLIDNGHGANTGETTVPAGATGFLVGAGYGDISPEVGITGTPVIDPAAGILYVVAKSVDSTGTIFYQRLHAIDLASGSERAGSPALIAGAYKADSGTTVNFSSRQQNQRAALTLTGGTIYIAWGSHEDAAPWYGWIMGYTYSGTAFTQQSALNVSPNTAESGIWMAGGGPSVDSNGHLYVITGNGQFDGAATSGTTDDYGDSFLQLMPGAGQQQLGVSSFFTPSDQAKDNTGDADFGSGGSALVLNLTGSASPAHIVVGGGKDGALYVLNGDQLGGSGDSNALQVLNLGAGIYATAAFWNNTLFLAPVGSPLFAYSFDPTSALFSAAAVSASATRFGFPGMTASVSATGAGSNGIVWGIDSSQYCTPQSGGCGPAVLHAYSAASVASELWNSALIGSDVAGNAVKFTVPTIANGKVYIGTRGNNTGDAVGNYEIDVYGLKPD
jgi:Putative Ig domain